MTTHVPRKILSDLLAWKNDPERKPLVVRGARQVGKSFVIEHFGQQEFSKLHVFNFSCDIVLVKNAPRRIILYYLRRVFSCGLITGQIGVSALT